ncbi:hypothetical protein [Paraburkholderia tuberum]|uniref:Uncharacterized protein n=1 Tax=Paraburkholderia tuberum TaxID=157910 RepID=A0A1H1JTA1_9BURK|nr:hypothetical protein [Paraburkholderia tuberum]SDR52737.1 hypothetical protein SAMN05445850_5533 [Paraburkholderia tuberum]
MSAFALALLTLDALPRPHGARTCHLKRELAAGPIGEGVDAKPEAARPRRDAAAEADQYARRTTKRPLLCFAFLAASPLVAEGLCRVLGAW